MAKVDSIGRPAACIGIVAAVCNRHAHLSVSNHHVPRSLTGDFGHGGCKPPPRDNPAHDRDRDCRVIFPPPQVPHSLIEPLAHRGREIGCRPGLGADEGRQFVGPAVDPVKLPTLEPAEC